MLAQNAGVGVDVSPFFLLLLFYLFLLIKWSLVKRPMLYLVGALGIALHFAGGFLLAGEGKTACLIFETIGLLVAFLCAVGACFGGDLPMQLGKMGEQKQE